MAKIFHMLKRISASRIVHGHTHDHDHDHDHNPHAQVQSQQTDAVNNLRLTWKSLAALGAVGGLVPSVSALVILLAAISLHRVGFGLLLILAFSGGMAVVLAGIGLLLVYTRKFMERIPARAPLVAGIIGLLPTAAALIVLAGALALVWWGWQTADASLLLLGVRLC